MAIQKKLYTVQEFDAFLARPENQDRLFELIDGEIVEKMPTEEQGLIVARISGEIYIYLKSHPGGRLGVEIRNRIPGDEHNSRQPDVSYFADITRPVVQRGAVPQMPDLAIEVKSPDDTYKLMREKADYYLANGARMVWLIYPEKQLLEVHTQDTLDILNTQDTLSGGDVLPGFLLPVHQIFAQEM